MYEVALDTRVYLAHAYHVFVLCVSTNPFLAVTVICVAVLQSTVRPSTTVKIAIGSPTTKTGQSAPGKHVKYAYSESRLYISYIGQDGRIIYLKGLRGLSHVTTRLFGILLTISKASKARDLCLGLSHKCEDMYGARSRNPTKLAYPRPYIISKSR